MAEIKYDTSAISMVIGYAKSIGGSYQEIIDLLDSTFEELNKLMDKVNQLKEQYDKLDIQLTELENEYIPMLEIDYDNDSTEEIKRKEVYNNSLQFNHEKEIKELEIALNIIEKELRDAEDELKKMQIKANNFYENVVDFNAFLDYVDYQIKNEIDNLNTTIGPMEFDYEKGEPINLDNQTIVVKGKWMDFFDKYGSVDQNGLAVINKPMQYYFESNYDDEMTNIINKIPPFDANPSENQRRKDEADRLVKFANEKYGISEDDAYIVMRSLNLIGACTYADMCNVIYELYDFDSEKFEDDFGYPIINKDGTLNGNQLLLDLYIDQNYVWVDDEEDDYYYSLFVRDDTGIHLSTNFVRDDNGDVHYNNDKNQSIMDVTSQLYTNVYAINRFLKDNGSRYSKYSVATYCDSRNYVDELEDYDGELEDYDEFEDYDDFEEYDDELEEYDDFEEYADELEEYNDDNYIIETTLEDEGGYYDKLSSAISDGKIISLSTTIGFTIYNLNNPDFAYKIDDDHAVTPVAMTEDGVLVRSWGELYYLPYEYVKQFDVITLENAN